ncbi:MAG: mannose-6-phosphate isomerase, class I [Deltaproteobacteria bacterium]|nr:mannose-6-phosphate isomerase, class I [Deltaproteobacteria bacterium]
MKTIGILKNTVQDYAWGSLTAIPELLGQPATGSPQAELWMGAHPKAPSQVYHEGKWESLLQVIESHPTDVLGAEVAERFGGKLPYLFKVLAAAKPLSIQAHPNSHQAKEGFERENRLGISLMSSKRNYKDDSHKPECICALTRFWGMNGFRGISEIVKYLGILCGDVLKDEIALLEKQPDSQGLKFLFQSLLTMPPEKKATAISSAVSHAGSIHVPGDLSADPMFQWVRRLHAEYPGDVGVLFPALFNLFCLEPGQALYLASGEPHAYLEGVSIELMANSDNVLRGGLTPKHLDVPELLNILTFQERVPPVILPRKRSGVEWVYDTPAEEFSLSVISVFPKICWISPEKRSADILLCTRGQLVLENGPVDDPIHLFKGVSVVVPASAGEYHLYGNGVCYKASVPGPAGFMLDTRAAES